MINNFDLIKPLLEFKDKNSFYFIQIIKRRKENPDMLTGMYVQDIFYIYDMKDMNKMKNRIIESCEKNNARAYINLNVLDCEKVASYALKNCIDLIIQKDYKAVKNAYTKACSKNSSKDNKKWVVDIDENNINNTLEIKNLIQKLHDGMHNKKYKIIAEIPTKNGIHIITNPFNLKVFKDEIVELKFEDIDVHKNSPTLLYIS